MDLCKDGPLQRWTPFLQRSIHTVCAHGSHTQDHGPHRPQRRGACWPAGWPPQTSTLSAFWRDSSTAASAGSRASLSAARVAVRADMSAARMDGRMPARTCRQEHGRRAPSTRPWHGSAALLGKHQQRGAAVAAVLPSDHIYRDAASAGCAAADAHQGMPAASRCNGRGCITAPRLPPTSSRPTNAAHLWLHEGMPRRREGQLLPPHHFHIVGVHQRGIAQVVRAVQTGVQRRKIQSGHRCAVQAGSAVFDGVQQER